MSGQVKPGSDWCERENSNIMRKITVGMVRSGVLGVNSIIKGGQMSMGEANNIIVKGLK
jgi:hypothetical protein